MVALSRRNIHSSRPLTSTFEEDRDICNALLSLKSLVGWRLKTFMLRKKRNTTRRKREDFQSLVFLFMNEQKRKVLPRKTQRKKLSRTLKKKSESEKSFLTDFAPQQLFKAISYEEIRRMLTHCECLRGWKVEKVPRKDGSREDTYYTYRKTRQRFRSLKQVRAFVQHQLPPK